MARIYRVKRVLLLLTLALLLFTTIVQYLNQQEQKNSHTSALINTREVDSKNAQKFEQQFMLLAKEMEERKLKVDGELDRFKARDREMSEEIANQRRRNNEMERVNKRLTDQISEMQLPRRPGRRTEPAQVSLAQTRSLNVHLSSEYEVLQYSTFTKDLVYELDPGLNGKPEASPIGHKKIEKDEVMQFALDAINLRGAKYTPNDLLYGYQRTDRVQGSQYELFFKSNEPSQSKYQHLTLFRPFAPLQLVQAEAFDKTTVWVNVIVPLSGRLATFKQYLSFFLPMTKTDKFVHLTVVYFGEDGRREAEDMLKMAALVHNFEHYTFLFKNEVFSRGAGLQAGAKSWDSGDVLLLFCDVDIYFYSDFLNRCRLNSVPTSKVYYPIVFSLFNPNLVYNGRVFPSLREQLIISPETGIWRSFGFGMACMYRSDFMAIKGFHNRIEGWGGEDVILYRHLIGSNIEVVRAPDPSIFHIWHDKVCNSSLSTKQYNMCIGSKLKSDASITQLGILLSNKTSH